MDTFVRQFVMEMFLETDSVSTMNRVAVAASDVINENNGNISKFTEVLEEFPYMIKDGESKDAGDTPMVNRKQMYYEETIMNYNDEEYYQRFGMKNSTVQALINFLSDYINPGTSIVPLHKKVHLFLWLVINDASYGEIGALFGLHRSSVAYIFNEIASLLADHRYHFVSWPSIEEQHVTRIKVNSWFKFPNCVGFIDACMFKVGKRKKKYRDTILLQAVCDETLSFIDIHIGDIGVTKKSKLFKESQLAQELKNFVDFDNHILGDSEYKLRKNLITPFSTQEVVTPEEMKFNEVHLKARGFIGHAFEILRERFRKLNHIDINKPETVNSFLYAVCVLHNFIILHEGCPDIKQEPVICDDGVTIDPSIVKTSSEKRQFLCNYINFIDTS